MPGYDGTGPMGAGPMTGWGRGYCNPAGRTHGPAYGWSPGYGRGYGRGRGFGRGFGWRRGPGFAMGWHTPYPAAGSQGAMNPADELEVLREEAEAMKRDLEAVNHRIVEIEKASTEAR